VSTTATAAWSDQASPGFDPVIFEVVRHALVAVADEMAAALRRSAYSTNIKTRADFSCALFDRELRTIAQASCQPVHLGSMAELVPRAIEEYGPENLVAGDAVLTNDPYRGGVHLNDITLIAPVYYDGELLGYVASLAHHVDVGGGAAASIGAFQEIFQEGVIIPPVKFMQAGQLVPDVSRLVLAQVRAKREVAGDFRAQVAANNTGARRLCGLATRLGTDGLRRHSAQLLAYTADRTATSLRCLPRGRFEAEGWVDSDGFTDMPVRLAVSLTIDSDGVLFDLTGCDAQRRAPVNATFAQTFSACAYVLKCLVGEDVPVNDGFYRQVRVIAPEGTVVNCRSPAPVVGGWETQTRLVDVILRALSAALPDQVPAGTKAMMAQVGFGGVDPRNGELYAFYEAIAGGYGGRATRDGPDAVQTHGQNTENAPVEEVELNYPVRIARYELVDNSDGPGTYRGGLGLRRDYTFPDHEVSFTILSDRDRWGPAGLFGGLPGRKARYVLNPGGDSVVLGSKTTLQVKPGDVVSFQTCGGGGYGPPHERDPMLVLRDVRDGKVSLERARDVYLVAIDDHEWSVDEAATAEIRAARA
jgi:N-methylhydantoinase B